MEEALSSDNTNNGYAIPHFFPCERRIACENNLDLPLSRVSNVNHSGVESSTSRILEINPINI